MKKSAKNIISNGIILLNKNNTIDVVTEKKFCEVFHKKKIKHILFPVGEDKNEYVKVDVNNIPDTFKRIVVDYKLCLQFFIDPDAQFDTIYENRIEIKDLTSLYKFVHSIYNIQGVNSYINNEVYDEFMEFILDEFIITIEYENGKIVRNDTREVSANEAYPYMNSTFCSTDTHTPYILSILDLTFFGKNYKDHTLVTGSDAKDNICIDAVNGVWYKLSDRSQVYEKMSLRKYDMSNGILQTIDCNNFNSYVFIHPEDIMMLERYVHSINMTTFIYQVDNEYDLPSDFNYSFNDISDSPMCNIVYDKTCSIFEPINLLELVVHLTYFSKSLVLLFDHIYGTLGVVGIDIQMNFSDDSQLIYTVKNTEILSGKQFYDEFIEFVRLHVAERRKLK